MRPLAALLALVAVMAAAGCGALDPYPTAPRAGQPGQPGGPRVAICYNTMKTTIAAVQAEAQRECPAGTAARSVDTDWYIQNCPLLLPARATFVCAPSQ